MKLWNWLSRNVASFQALGQGLAGLAVAGTAVVVIWGFWESSTPDLLLWSQRNESTIPVDLIKWSKNVAEELQSLPKQSVNEPPILDRLRPLAASDIAKRLPHLYSRDGLERLTLVVKNQAKHTVTGTRLRVMGLLGRLWDVHALGTFLTEEEAKVFVQQIKSAFGDGNINLVLPELPPLPPQNSLTIELFGNFSPTHTEATIKVPADNFAVLDYVEVQRSRLIDMYLNPREIFVPAILLLLLFICLGDIIWQRSKRKTMYNAARHVALEGHYSAAMHLLEKAFEAGYSNREHAKSDPDLEPLRAREDFKKLIGDPPESTP